jgi:hypothetical protein
MLIILKIIGLDISARDKAPKKQVRDGQAALHSTQAYLAKKAL